MRREFVALLAHGRYLNWDTMYRFKLQGMRITYLGENLYLFDLSSKEAFLPQKRDPVTGKVPRAEPIYDTSWLESFGLSVEEHTASTQIDLANGFITPEVSPDSAAQPVLAGEFAGSGTTEVPT